MKVTEKAAVKLSEHTHITYLLSTSLASCKLKNGFRRFVPHIIYVTITNSQRHKNRMLIVIHFNLPRSFFYRDPLLAV